MFPFYGRGSHAQLSYLEAAEIIQISCSEPQTEFPISEEVESKVRIKLRGLNQGSWSKWYVSASYSAPTDLDSIVAHYPIWGQGWSQWSLLEQRTKTCIVKKKSVNFNTNGQNLWQHTLDVQVTLGDAGDTTCQEGICQCI